MDCRKCPYFVKNKEPVFRGGSVILGFCNLREKYVSDETINNEFCKDKAVIPRSNESSN